MQGFAACPNLPFGLCPRLWDEAHRPEDTEDDAALYGSDSAGSSPAATWLLVAAALLGLVGLIPSGSYTLRNPSRTCGLVGVLGSAVGLYLGLELFPGQAVIQVKPQLLCMPFDACTGTGHVLCGHDLGVKTRFVGGHWGQLLGCTWAWSSSLGKLLYRLRSSR